MARLTAAAGRATHDALARLARAARTRLPVSIVLFLTTAVAVAEPVALHFAPGAYDVTVHGRMSPTVFKHEYSLDVRKRQKLIFHFDGDGPLYGTVQCQGGGDGPFSDGFEFVVPQSGDCVVDIGISRMAERWTGPFTLTITAR